MSEKVGCLARGWFKCDSRPSLVILPPRAQPSRRCETGPLSLGRQRFEQRMSDTHCKAALRLPKQHLRHQGPTAFKDTIGLGRCVAPR